MSENTTCAACGAVLAPDAPAGNCPLCLFRQVLTVSDAARPLIRFFGDYELLTEIAHGGMGIVYRARQISLNRPVALKMILAGHLASPSLVQRFQAEAGAAARLDHPNIIPIYEIGEHDGQHYYSMRLVEGGSLADLIKKEQRSVKGVKGIPPSLTRLQGSFSIAQFAKIARAVHHAHQRGVLHRDLKPTNIVLDSTGEPHVSDFGLAKILEDNLDLTQSLAVLGTPAYMAPEQAAGQSKHLTIAADVYSLGAILYELLCGQPPFRAETALATLRQVAEQHPLRPSFVNPNIDHDLETICLKCLEKDPARRYISAEALAEDLDRCGRGEPVLAQPISTYERAWRWCSRRPALASALAALVLVFLAGFASVTWQWRRAEFHAHREERQHKRAEEFATRMVVEKADALFGQDRSADGLALLAQLLHQFPTHQVAAERTISALSQRSFCLPVAALRHAGPINTMQLAPNGGWLLTTSDDKSARLWDIASGHQLFLLQHQEAVVEGRFNADGRRVLTASRDHTAQVWDAQTGRPAGPPLQHEAAVNYVEFSSVGDRVLTASDDRTARLWDAVTGAALMAPLSHGSNVMSAHFSPDGERLVTAARDKMVRVWNARSGELITTIHNRWEADQAKFTPDGSNILVGSADLFDPATGKFRNRQFALHTPRIYSVQFSPDGQKAVTASADSTARIWDLASHASLAGPLPHDSRVYEAHFATHGLTVVTCSKDRTVRLWDAITGRPLCEPLWHDSEVRSAQITPDGRRVVTQPVGDTAWIWDVRILQPLTPTFAHDDAVRSVAFSRDGKLLLTASWDNTARLWDVRTETLRIQPFQHRGWVNSAQFSPDHQLLVTVSHDGTARVWAADTGEMLAKLTHRDVVSDAEFSPDNQWIVTASQDGTAQVWEARTGQRRGAAMEHDAAVHSARFSPNGERIVTASSDGTARLWEAASGREVTARLQQVQPVQNARFSPDGQKIVTACLNGQAQVWEASSGRALDVLFRHDDEFDLSSPQFDPAGSRVVTATRNSARVWDLLTGQLLTEPLMHSERITSAHFAPSGRHILTTSKDQSARLWDANSGLPVSEAMIHSNGVVAAQFSADGRWIATASYDGLARIWEVPPQAWPPPAWLASLAEAVGGKRLDERRSAQHVPLLTLLELRGRILAQISPDLASWPRWFFAESAERTISPSSPITVTEYVQRRMEDKNIESICRAVQLSPTNGMALARLARAVFSQKTNRPASALGSAAWYAQRAVEVSPDEVETWLTQAKLLERDGKIGPALDAIMRAVMRLPNHPALWNAQGILLARTNRLNDAYIALSKAITLTVHETNFPNVRAKALAARAEVLRAHNRLDEARADFLAAKKIPMRLAQASADLIDLTAHYNAGLAENWRGLYEGDDLSALPQGLLTVDGLTFDVRGVVQLSGGALRRKGRRFPERISGMAVGRSCRNLHFLHAAGYVSGGVDGTKLAHFTVHYADGTKCDAPLLFGRDISLHWARSLPANSSGEAVAAWRGRPHPKNSPAGGLFPVLYRTTWTNPTPQIPIVTLDFQSAMSEVDYFLVAVSVD